MVFVLELHWPIELHTSCSHIMKNIVNNMSTVAGVQPFVEQHEQVRYFQDWDWKDYIERQVYWFFELKITYIWFEHFIEPLFHLIFNRIIIISEDTDAVLCKSFCYVSKLICEKIRIKSKW